MVSFAFLPLLAVAVHAVDHTVVVGGPNILAYNPPNITAAPGDTITFQFHEKNHTVTQAAFASPCTPLAGADGSLIGFNSGFMPVSPDTMSGFPTYTITVNDTNPIWAYCAQKGPPAHCAAGMVFSANAPLQGNTFDAFRAAAMATGGGASSSYGYSSSSSSAWTSPPPPVVSTVTATVTEGNSVYTTTYASWEGAAPNPTPNPQPTVHTIVVGGSAGLVFSPPTVVAEIGDTVSFEFHAKNHTATQSFFNTPCQKASLTGVGFDSGFMPVEANATTFPTFNITVNTTSPIWGYCRQQGPPVHCQQGMVFGINPPTSGPNNFTAFQDLAIHSNATSSNSTSSSGSGSGSGSGGSGSSGSGSSGSGSNGAGRAAVSAGLSVGVIGAIAAIML